METVPTHMVSAYMTKPVRIRQQTPSAEAPKTGPAAIPIHCAHAVLPFSRAGPVAKLMADASLENRELRLEVVQHQLKEALAKNTELVQEKGQLASDVQRSLPHRPPGT